MSDLGDGGAPTRIELLEAEIDARLVEVWNEAWEHESFSLDLVAALMRAAYGRGYVHALQEVERAKLCRDFGYRIPEPMPERVE